MKPALNNLKKSPDCMQWFSWGFLTTSDLQEEPRGRTHTSQETWSVSGTIFYLGAGQGGGDALDVLPRNKEEILRCNS